MIAEDLLSPGMPDKLAELIEGELVTVTPPGPFHNRIAFRLQRIFSDFCRARPELEFGGAEDGFLISRAPDTMLIPDACMFRHAPWPEKPWREFAPELWVEVLSPSNSPTEMAFKRHALFAAGTRQFWTVSLAQRSLTIHYSDGRNVVFSGNDTITCEGIAEGLSFSLAEIFSER